MADVVTAEELRSFIERFESMEEEKHTVTDAQKEMMAELASRGYDRKAFKEVIRLRKMKPDQRAEFEAVVELYRQAAGL